MSSVKGPGSEGAERSGDACEEDKVFDAAAALDAADARATPATASSSTRAAAAAPPARNDVEPFELRLRAAERAMARRSRG